MGARAHLGEPFAPDSGAGLFDGALKTRVLLGLGSNLGNREARIAQGLQGLRAGVDPEAVSSIYESAAVLHEAQPDFLNVALLGSTDLSPAGLLDLIRAVEAEAGRIRSFRGAPRTLDVDLLFYGNRVIREDELVVPHPSWRERSFVLAPLAEIAPGWRDPESGKTVEEVCRARPSLVAQARKVSPPPVLEEDP